MAVNKYLPFIVFLLPSILQGQSFTRNDTVFNQTGPRGMKQGYWEKNYPDGTMEYRGYFVDDQPVGEFVRYHENGHVKAKMYFTGKNGVSYARLYYGNGTLAGEGKYIGTLKDSIWKYYSFYGGHLSYMENYLNGKKEGISVKYYPDGSVGEKLEWKNDHRHGLWEQYYIDGTLLLKSSYANDRLNGPYTIWHKNGAVAISGNYRMDVREGDWEYYDEEGNLKVTITYRNGVPLNKDQLLQQELEFLNRLEQNKGKFTEPEIEDLIRK
jgi:antitoxin component YwqK of YwqJK toxin-antitoxin module